MKLADSFRLSVNSIMHRKLRSWLTLLGVVIGVAAVVSIISIGEGMQASVAERLSGLGADLITVSAGYSRAGGFMGAFREGPPGEGSSRNTGSSRDTTSTYKEPTLTEKDATMIKGNPNVLMVNETVSGRGELVFLAEKSSVSIQGVNTNTWKNIANLTLASGRSLSASDSTAIVIGNRIASEMFKQPITIGRRVVIEDKPFTVVGILESTGTGMQFGSSDSTVYMSFNSAWDVTDINRGIFSSIQAKVVSAELVEETTLQLTQSLLVSRRVTESTQNFTVTSSQAMEEQVSSITETLTLFLAAIAAVSLIVGAVGVANSMFTSVLEKTRLIGILKALGSTNNEILRIFIIESGLFGLVGGIIGVILGTLISVAMSAIGIISLPMMGSGGMSTLVTPQLVIIAIALSTIIGIVSGIMPARAAAKLRPVDALRYE
jgi:putative ABC transport system permease protein